MTKLFLVILLGSFLGSFSFGDITIRVANLKQDMELVTRELAGLRTEVELLRRENAQLRIQVEQATRKQSSNSGASTQILQKMSERIQSIENRKIELLTITSHTEKT